MVDAFCDVLFTYDFCPCPFFPGVGDSDYEVSLGIFVYDWVGFGLFCYPVASFPVSYVCGIREFSSVFHFGSEGVS